MRSTISTDLSIYKVYMILDASILRKCEQFSYINVYLLFS